MALMETYVVIRASLEPLKRGLALAKTAVSKAISAMQATINKMISVSKKVFLGLAAAIGVSTWAAKKQEKAEHMLAAALKATGDYTGEAFQKFKQFASSIQEITTYGDEEVLMLMQLMKSLGVLPKNLEEATKQAIGLAAATGRDVQSMAMYIALAQQGEFTMLRRYIPALRSTTDATEQLRIVNEFAANGFKLARAETEIASGSLVQMKNAIGDVAEAIGRPFLKAVTQTAKRIKEWAKTHQDAIGRVAASFERLLEVATAVLMEFVGPIIDKLGDLASKFAGFVTEAKLTNVIWAVGKWADKIWGYVKAVWDFIVDLWKSSALGDVIGHCFDVAMQKLKDFGEAFLAVLLGIGKSAIVISIAIGRGIWKGISEKIFGGKERDIERETKKRYREAGGVFKEEFVPTPSGGPMIRLAGPGTVATVPVDEELYRRIRESVKEAFAAETIGPIITPAVKQSADIMVEAIKKAADILSRSLPKDIKLSPEAENAVDKFKIAVDEMGRQVEEKWAQTRKEFETADKSAQAAKDLAEGVVAPAAKAPAAVAGTYGITGLREAWSQMVSGMKVDPLVVQEKETTIAVNKVASAVKETSEKEIKAMSAWAKEVGVVGP